jgi:hypothetical protein
MKRHIAIALILILTLFSTGCTTYWYQEGKTFEECEQDIRHCHSEAKMYADSGVSLGFYDIHFEDKCMRQRGYRHVHEWELPLRVKREASRYSTDRHGTAGLLVSNDR